MRSAPPRRSERSRGCADIYKGWLRLTLDGSRRRDPSSAGRPARRKACSRNATSRGDEWAAARSASKGDDRQHATSFEQVTPCSADFTDFCMQLSSECRLASRSPSCRRLHTKDILSATLAGERESRCGFQDRWERCLPQDGPSSACARVLPHQCPTLSRSMETAGQSRKTDSIALPKLGTDSSPALNLDSLRPSLMHATAQAITMPMIAIRPPFRLSGEFSGLAHRASWPRCGAFLFT